MAGNLTMPSSNNFIQTSRSVFASPPQPILSPMARPSLTKLRAAGQSYSQRFSGLIAPPFVPQQERHRSLFPLVLKPCNQWRLVSSHTEPLLMRPKPMTSS
ncbi:unnamed protein product [Prunus armeniaca]